MRQRVGAGRRDEQRIGPEAQLDVVVPLAGRRITQKARQDGLFGEGAQREGRDEGRGGFGEDDLHFGPGLHQQARERGRFISRDTTADAQQNTPARRGEGGVALDESGIRHWL